MEWVSTELATVGGVLLMLAGALVIMIKAFRDIVKNMGVRADPAVLNIIAMMQTMQSKRDEEQGKRDEEQAENSCSQAESLKRLAASQESQVKSMEYLGQMQQAAVNALTTTMEQLKPIPTMAASIQTIEEQSIVMVVNMDSQEQLLNEIIRRLDGLQKTLDDIKPRMAETEEEVAIIRGQVLEIKKGTPQEQEIPVVKTEPIEQGVKPDERTIEQLDDLAGGSGSASDDKRDGDGSGSEASASASAS